LLEVGYEEEEILEVENGLTLSEGDLQSLEDRSLSDRDEMINWIEHLEDFGVFFSRPLDLDWSMLKSFEDAYEEAAPNQPRGDVESARKSVLKGSDVYEEADEADIYSDEDDDRFQWYRYLFSSRSKPSSHLGALSSMQSDERNLVDNMPDELKSLLKYAEEQIQDIN
jgi:hypothetical protein